MKDTSLPLSGVTVLDLTLALAGPLATQRLAELGAEVIKVEAPNGGDFARYVPIGEFNEFGDSTAFVMMNRNKRSVCLDLKSEMGRGAFYKLVERADVLLQNFRPGVAERLHIDFEALKVVNEKLVYVSISGYGSEGSMTDRPGQDLLLQSFSGLTMNGGVFDGNPQPSPVFIVDVAASHLATEAVLAGLIKSGRSGEAQYCEVTMIGAIMELQLQEISTHLAHKSPPKRSDYDAATVWMAPPYGIHRTGDGFLAMAQCDLHLLAHLLHEPRLSHLASDAPTFDDQTSYKNWRDRVYQLLGEKLSEKTAKEWDAYLHKNGVWCMAVLDYDEFLHHPQTKRFLTEVEHYKYGPYTTVKPAIEFRDLDPVTLFSAPRYAADTIDVLSEKGFEAGFIKNLLSQGGAYQASAEPAQDH